jgi:hypothetical protein
VKRRVLGDVGAVASLLSGFCSSRWSSQIFPAITSRIPCASRAAESGFRNMPEMPERIDSDVAAGSTPAVTTGIFPPNPQFCSQTQEISPIALAKVKVEKYRPDGVSLEDLKSLFNRCAVGYDIEARFAASKRLTRSRETTHDRLVEKSAACLRPL